MTTTLPQDARRSAHQVALAALCVYLASAGGSLATMDAVTTYEVTKSIVHDRSVALPPGYADFPEYRGSDGRYYAPFGIGQSLYNIPFYLAGAAAEQVIGRIGAPETVTKAAVSIGSTVAAAACVWITCLFAYAVSRQREAATITAACLACATALWPYAKFGYSAALTALLLSAAVFLAWMGRERDRPHLLVGCGIATAALLLTRHEMILAGLVLVAWVFWQAPLRRRWIHALAIALPMAGGVLAWMLYNYVRFGDALYSGHVPHFGVAGLTGLLVSPGGSLLLYSPPAVIGAAALIRWWRTDAPSAALPGGIIIALFVFYGSLEDWLGTRSYGPRYLVPLLPLFCVALAPALASGKRRWRRATLGFALVGTLVQLPGILVDPGKVNVTLGRPGPVSADERRYAWELSAFVLNARASIDAVAANARYVTGVDEPPVPAAVPGKSFSDQFAHSLDFWWLYLLYLRVIPRALALAAPVVLVVAALVLWRRS